MSSTTSASGPSSEIPRWLVPDPPVLVLPDSTETLHHRLRDTPIPLGHFSVTADYSGRHMYGVTRLAINVTTEDRFAVIAALALAYAGTSGPGVGWIGDARIDNLGLGWVLYWPDVRLCDDQPRQWPNGEEDADG